MIPEEYKSRVIQDGIHFMNAITQAYGTEHGMKLWDQITSVLDPSVKGEIFFALITGQYNNRVIIRGQHSNQHSITRNRLAIIKCIRAYTGLGLKESKDICDEMWNDKVIEMTVVPSQRQKFIEELKAFGITV